VITQSGADATEHPRSEKDSSIGKSSASVIPLWLEWVLLFEEHVIGNGIQV
jgi:hypothetical protein